MVELFRYIEQAFVIPEEGSSVDLSSDSNFQQGTRDLIANGAEPDVVRESASAFLDGLLADANHLERLPRYERLRTGLRALKDPQPDDVTDLVGTIFDQTPDALVQSSEFLGEKRMLNDALVAIKMTTGFDRPDAAAMTAMRQSIAFLEDFVACISPLSRDEIRNRLNRPLQVPEEFILKESAHSPAPTPTDPPEDPAKARLEALAKEQAALQGAYDAVLRVHPSQLQIATDRKADAASAKKGRVVEARGVEMQTVLQPTTSFVAIPQRTLSALDDSVRALIARELPERADASLPNVVDVVKRRWLEISHEIEPYKMPLPARIYRLGMHVFAVEEPPVMKVMSGAAPAPPQPEPDFSYAVTRPVGIGNLQVVRQELIGYEAADISHIENVMPGELMRRDTRREETNELIVTDERETTQSEERDLQTTQRNELATESQKEASQQSVATQDQTTTTNYGRLVENSKTNYARSVTDRAVNKLTQMVRHQRVQREKKVFMDRAMHELNNSTGSDPIRGIYQWVDKKYKTRIVNTGKRLLYDVVVPEPASFLVDSLKKAAQPENFQLIRPSQPWIAPSGLNASNYMAWAAHYGVTGQVAPPPEEFLVTVAHTDTKNVGAKIQAYGKTFEDVQVYQAFTIQIPENYKAISCYVQRTAIFYDPATPLGHEIELFIGGNYFIRFGPDHKFLDKHFTMNGEAGTLPVTVASRKPLLQFNFAIGVNCQRTDKALEQWQLKTHATIMAGYQRQRAEYLDQLARYQAAVRSQMALAHNFAHDSAMERQELKKAFIHLLVSEHFPKAYIPTPNPQVFPTDPLWVKKWGAVVAFFERAFEWENLMYVYYPYFWGRPARWGELILTQDLDPQFEAFLRAGAARIVVPARPGFEAALAHYHETGDVWMGEEIPDMFSKQYVSIITEIKARNATPDEEVCVAEWDVRLPTTLVMLKEDAKLPEWTPEKECTPPVE